MKFSPAILAGAAFGLLATGVATGLLVSNFAGGGETVTDAGRGGGPGRGGGGRGGRGGYTPVVTMAAAEQAAIGRTIEVIGQARALKSVAITAEVTGLVEEVNIAPGARVTEGDVLLQIDDDEQQVALARAQSEFPIAKENAERYKNLESDAAASALEAEQAQNNFTAVRAQLRAAEVAVSQRKIRAPFDGIAGLTNIEVGDYLRAGDIVTTLDDTSSIIIEFSVPQEAAAFVNIGQDVSAALTSAAGRTYAGTITAIDSRVDSVSRALRIEAEFPNTKARLIPGSVFTVSTTATGEPAVAIPGLAIQWDRSGAYVWRRGSDGVAERASVIILQRTDETVLVEGDLDPGDAVAVEGADRVRNGVPLPALSPGGGLGVSGANGAE